VVVVTGVTSVAVDDILAQLREAEEAIELVVKRVPITRPVEVAKAVRESTDGNLIVVTRGGGQDVAALDDNALLAVVANCPVSVATALGHATDSLVLDRMADHSFPTPTACGAWLCIAIEQKRANVRAVLGWWLVAALLRG
jgi:exodeoxyribonuclease VII large subunit